MVNKTEKSVEFTKGIFLRTIKVCRFEIIDGVKYVNCIKHPYKFLLREQVRFAAVLWRLRQCVSCWSFRWFNLGWKSCMTALSCYFVCLRQLVYNVVSFYLQIMANNLRNRQLPLLILNPEGQAVVILDDLSYQAQNNFQKNRHPFQQIETNNMRDPVTKRKACFFNIVSCYWA